MGNDSSKKKSTIKKGGKYLPALCSILGYLTLFAVFVACIPITVPQFMGYIVINDINGRADLDIPAGSALLLKSQEPADVEVGKIIAFRYDDDVLLRYVDANNVEKGTFDIERDDTETQFRSGIPYEQFIGVYVRHFSNFGQILVILTSRLGVILVLCLTACGVLLIVLGRRLEDQILEQMRQERRLQKQKEAEEAEKVEEAGEAEDGLESPEGSDGSVSPEEK